jgi:hypothetical protein
MGAAKSPERYAGGDQFKSSRVQEFKSSRVQEFES